MEFRVRRADGSYGWALAHGVPKYLNNGTFVGYSGELSEITPIASHPSPEIPADPNALPNSRKLLCEIASNLKHSALRTPASVRLWRARRSAPISAEALLQCLNVSVTPMVVLDERGRVVFSNAAFQAFSAKALAPPKAHAAPPAAQNLQSDKASSSARRSNPAMGCTPEVQAWLSSNWVYDEQDLRIAAQPLGMFGQKLTAFSIIDISSEKKNRLHSRAFLHDLSNAANGIQMLIDLMTVEPSGEERSEYVKLLHASMNQLLSEIDHERAWLENSGLTPSVCDVHDVLEELLRDYRSHTSAKNCCMDIAEEGAGSLKVLCDKTVLVKMLDNVLRTILRATGGVGVAVGCRLVSGEVEFWFHCPGVISRQVRLKMLDHSIQVKESRRSLENDAFKRSCELYLGGTLTISSDEEHGTTFSVRFPAADGIVFTQRHYDATHAS